MTDFDAIWIEFECPQCNYEIDIQFVDVRTERSVFCYNCKASITLKDESASVHTGIDRMTDALRALEQSLKNFGK